MSGRTTDALLAAKDARITELNATIERLKAIADSQASVLRGLTEWAEALPEQARDIWTRTE